MPKAGETLNRRFIRTVKCPVGQHDLAAYSVDGTYIRSNIDVGWVAAGHHLADKFIPKNEIWVEQIYPDEDKMSFIYGHELPEHVQMAHGKRYTPSHDEANADESKYRQEHYGVKAPRRSEGNF